MNEYSKVQKKMLQALIGKRCHSQIKGYNTQHYVEKENVAR